MVQEDQRKKEEQAKKDQEIQQAKEQFEEELQKQKEQNQKNLTPEERQWLRDMESQKDKEDYFLSALKYCFKSMQDFATKLHFLRLLMEYSKEKSLDWQKYVLQH